MAKRYDWQQLAQRLSIVRHSNVREHEVHAVQDSKGLIARANVRRVMAESGERPTHDVPESYFILDTQDLHALVKVP